MNIVIKIKGYDVNVFILFGASWTWHFRSSIGTNGIKVFFGPIVTMVLMVSLASLAYRLNGLRASTTLLVVRVTSITLGERES